MYQKGLSLLEQQEAGFVLKHFSRLATIFIVTLFVSFPGFFLILYAELVQISGGFLLLFPLALLVYFYRRKFAQIWRELKANIAALRTARLDDDGYEDQTLTDYLIQNRTVTIKVLREEFGFAFQKANDLLRELEAAGFMVKNKDHGNARMLRDTVTHDELDRALDNWNDDRDLTFQINSPGFPVFEKRNIQ